MNHGLILIDLDMVIANFHGGFQEIWKQKFPERDVILLEDRKSFYLTRDHDKLFESDIEEIINAENFILGLDFIPGASEGFRKLVDQYQNVRICTTSLRNPFSSGEKWKWVYKNLGKKEAEEMVICNDKTLIKAAYLIDDKPIIKGVATPEWRHIIFTQPYNREIEGRHFIWGDDLILE